MSTSIAREIAALERMTVPQLRRRYAEVFKESTNANHRAWLIKRIAWRLQALAEGDLSERARRRAAELANDADLRLNPPKGEATVEPSARALEAIPSTVTLALPVDKRLPAPGSVLMRPYKGRMIQVLIRTDGFEYEGEVYPSLSAVAGAVTGSHCNGFLFFKGALNGKGGDA
jgi:hypothetical protein